MERFNAPPIVRVRSNGLFTFPIALVLLIVLREVLRGLLAAAPGLPAARGAIAPPVSHWHALHSWSS